MNGERAFSDVLRATLSDLQSLVRSEARLAKAELREDAQRALSAGIWLGLGAMIALAAGMLLLWAAVFALATRLPLWGAALVVGGVTACAGIGLLMVSLRQWRQVRPMPERTVASVREDVEWVRQSTR